MCGICGIYDPAGSRPEHVQAMLKTIIHRGPDDEGQYVQGPIALGSRRLSIIDVPGGSQPISNEDGSIWIVFNGEIYNYPELRQQLESAGHHFSTHSDTEVIVHLYEEYGEQCVDHLSGMFAFAIWDAPHEKLLLARDRIGQKPLFYTLEDGRLLFSSEIKGLLAISQQERAMDEAALHYFLSLRFIPPPLTIFRGIRKLPAAHILVFESGRIRISQYWQLSFGQQRNWTEEELVHTLREKLQEVVRSHLISDVPVGAFLSGGLDSSMVVALMSEDVGEALQTFAVGVEESDFNELPYARLVADRYKTDHREACVNTNLIQMLPHMIWHMDEPSDPIAACMFHAAELASRSVKVVLGGDGGDELFAGFDRYTGNNYISWYRQIPGLMRNSLIGPLFAAIPDSFTYKSTTQKLRWVHQLASIDDAGERYAEATCFFRFNHVQKQQLYGSQLWKNVGEINAAEAIARPFNQVDSENLLDRMLYADFITRLPEHSLMLTDRMTMAHGLEARSPFLDHKLVEMMATVPARFKIQGRQTKTILRTLSKEYLPESIVQRQKQGFMFPIAYWFRGKLYPFLEASLHNSYFVRSGLFRKESIQQMLDEHRSGKVDHHVRLWMLLNLELWHQIFIEQKDRHQLEQQLTAIR
jgi:asparagine synthase (glutamine-hydrolysing)